jgi:limonene-1,2-epoxide hydrolase
MATAEDAERIVRDLCGTLEKHDAEAFRPFFTDDVVYHNMPMEPSVGIEATITFLAGFLTMFESTTVEILHLAARDNVVLTERIDTLTLGEKVAALPVMGTFEFRGDKICAWRDYFDLAQVTGMLSPEA